jgi:acetoin utilization deacetylase AcuC-like enzyme
MTITVCYDPKNYLHQGNRESSEKPQRIRAILNSLHETPSIHLKYEPYKGAIDITDGIYWDSSISTNCHACTFPMTKGVCEMCGTKQTHQWAYTNEVEGDTTYKTPYTKLIVMRANDIICSTAEKILRGYGGLHMCLTRPPGHHSCEDRRRGFCHRNFAVDAFDVFAKANKRALILDIDAHHGDGTEFEIQKRRDGYYISLHVFGENIYPGTGGISSENCLNLPLPPNTSSDVWLKEYFEKAIPKINEYKPDVIIVSAGFDGHTCDKIAPMDLTEDTYQQVGESLNVLDIPILAILEGGYNLSVLGQSVKAFCHSFTY